MITKGWQVVTNKKFDAKKRKINFQESEMVSIMSDILESQSKTVRRKRLDTVSTINRSTK